MPDIQSEVKKIAAQLPSNLQPKPITERVWLMVKDHPWKSGKRLAALLKLKKQAVSSALTTLQYRGMVQSRMLVGSRFKTEKEWAVAQGMETYELLPVLAEHKHKMDPRIPKPQPSPTPLQVPAAPKPEGAAPEKPQAEPAQAANSNLLVLVDNLSLSEARFLWNHLNTIFKPEK